MSFFRESLALPVRAFLIHRAFLRASLIVSNVFAWLLVFEIALAQSNDFSYALGAVAVLYGMSHALTFLLMPLGARAVLYGTRRALTFATVAYIGSLCSLISVFSLATNSHAFWIGITGFVVLTALYRVLYVVPFALNAELGFTEGRSFTLEVLLTLIPIFAGSLLASGIFGTYMLFIGGLVSASIALVMLIGTRTSYESYDLGYVDTFRLLFSRENGYFFSQAVCAGIQGAGLLFVWPLAVFLMLDGSYYFFGIVLSVTFFCVLFVRKLGRTIRTRVSRPLLDPVILGSAWILRLFAFSPLGYIAADVLHYAVVGPRGYHVDLATHEQDADAGSYIDELTTIKEMGLTLGRVCLAILVAVLSLSLAPVSVLFVTLLIAGIASLIAYLARAPRVA